MDEKQVDERFCKKCRDELTQRDIERCEELCVTCRVKEFDARIMAEADAYGFGYGE